MKFKDIVNHFEIEGEFPEYLLDESFNDVFLDGTISNEDGTSKISVTTRQNVTHQMFVDADGEYPVIIMSVLPNGRLNGVKFGRSEGQLKYSDEL